MYAFTHFGPPSPLSEFSSLSTREHAVSEVKFGHLNLCVLPSIHETSVETSTPLPPVEITSIQQDSSSAMTNIVAPLIEPSSVVVEAISEEIPFLTDDRFSTPVIPSSLAIPFQDHLELFDSPSCYLDTHTTVPFFSEHHPGFPFSPHIQGFPLPRPLDLFLPLRRRIVLIIGTGVLSFWGGFGASSLSYGGTYFVLA